MVAEIGSKFTNIKLENYVMMPNHIHGIIMGTKKENEVGAIHELPLQEEVKRRD
jgi:REP element-mobilizing transposase RayT